MHIHGEVWMPSAVVCKSPVPDADLRKFIAEPFERGFGSGPSAIACGAIFLLSSLEGAAVTQIKIPRCAARIHTIPACRGRHGHRAERQIARGEES